MGYVIVGLSGLSVFILGLWGAGKLFKEMPNFFQFLGYILLMSAATIAAAILAAYLLTNRA